MKTHKFILLLFTSLWILNSCDLNEDPPVLSEAIYTSDLQSASATVDGFYDAIAQYNCQERRYFLINGFSGLFVTNRGGSRVDNNNNVNLFSLKPLEDEVQAQTTFSGLYRAISRANAAIQASAINEAPSTSKELGLNDVIGHAYFVRAWSYFTLANIFGDLPLWTTLPDNDNIYKALSPAKDVYALIAEDAKMAAQLLNGAKGVGFPKQYAANMLLAKVYMTLATNPSLRSESLTEMDYWQMAYDEAIKVYGKYSLMSDYYSLFTLDGENSSESIFELQISQSAANSQMGRNFTPWKYKAGRHFGWLSVSALHYDNHAATYPDDPRIDGTFLFDYNRADTGGRVRRYPATSRNSFGNAHPYFHKFALKTPEHNNQFDDRNIIIFRYADLLLMLAEISNELQNGEQLGYVTEVLSRVGLTPRPEYSGSKEDFRDAIMQEYNFELLGEGETGYNNRRRGFEYFLEHTIKDINNHPNRTQYDLTLSEDPNEVMLLPIPQREINSNILID